jgi:Zn-dependent peptidase ImmA (M78 family)
LITERLSASKLLERLGIDRPEDIDVDAIAYVCGAVVLREKLHGSAARILGIGDKAFITIDSESPGARQRFSTAHELGHWMIDRGTLSGFECTEKSFVGGWSPDDPERRANRFAADLLMPEPMFAPAAEGREITFETVRTLCEQFRTSLTATAIRLVESGSFPSILVCSNSKGIKWKVRDRDLPEAIQLRETPGRYTNAAELLSGCKSVQNPINVQASDWFAHRRSKYYEIHEDSLLVGGEYVLTLLWWKNEQQLIDLDEEPY